MISRSHTYLLIIAGCLFKKIAMTYFTNLEIIHLLFLHASLY